MPTVATHAEIRPNRSGQNRADIEGTRVRAQDVDLVRLHQAGVPQFGIVDSAPGRRTIGEVVRYLCLMHDFA